MLLFCTFVAFAQSEMNKDSNWRIFAPENEEFSVESPVSLINTLMPDSSLPGLTSLKGVDDNRRYVNSSNGTYFYIFSDEGQRPKQYRFVLDFANSQNQLETTQSSGELLAQKFEFTDESDFFHIILCVNGKNRTYVFHTISPKKENKSVERFFSSLKLNGKLLAEAFSNSKTDKKVSVTITDPEPEFTEKSSVTTGGMGRGNRNQPDPRNPNQTPNLERTGVRILTKPRAMYTNFARFYEMTGKVLLRVTFSADGTIGAIKPISKLPFGLTQAAITAARGIRFEPATFGGAPFSVVKPVEYTFTMY